MPALFSELRRLDRLESLPVVSAQSSGDPFVDQFVPLDREPIGHPLGGDGTEWLLYGRLDDAAHRFRVDARAFARDRGRFNIYSPSREGKSVGGALGAEYRLTRSLELQAAATLEHGDADSGWTTSSLSARLRWVR